MIKFALVGVVGCVLCAGVAIHEWIYHQNHKYASGVSGVLVVLGIGGALGCAALAGLAWTLHERDVLASRRAVADFLRQQKEL